MVYAFVLTAAAIFFGDLIAPKGGLPGAADVAKYALPLSIAGLLAFHYHCNHSR